MFPLPFELSQLIIDQLWDDVTSLRAVCLVSKAAIPLTRRHLFYEVNYYFQDQNKSIRLLRILKSRTQPGEHVRSLRLIGPYTGPGSNQRQHIETVRKNGETISEITKAVRFIREIHVATCPGEIFTSYYSPGLLPRLRQVAIITLTEVSFMSFGSLAETLSYMPHCHSIRLENVTFGNEDTSSLSNDRAIPLRTIHLGLVSKRPIIEWLLENARQAAPKITTLVLKRITLQESTVIAKLLRSLGDTLEHLDITLRVEPSAVDAAKNIDLKYNTNLRFLAFDDWFVSLYMCPPEWCRTILESIRSPRLETIAFRFQGASLGVLTSSNISIIQNSELFPHLRTVLFENRSPYADQQLVARQLHDFLPGLSTRGLIKYKTIPEDSLFHWRNLYTSRVYEPENHQ